MTRTRPLRLSSGFSLIEVMVAVLVISIGLLGMAKMQALSLSNTGNSRLRALAAVEATSLASALQADRAYWAYPATGIVLTTATVTGATVTAASDTTLSTVITCQGLATNCSAVQMAAYDLQQWAVSMSGVIPNETASLSCAVGTPIAPATTAPVTCSITISWTENLVNSNSAQQVNATTQAALQTPTYTQIVEP